MARTPGDQGTLFGPAMPPRPARRRQPPKETTVVISAEAITAATVGRIVGERIIAEAIRAARPDVRNVAADLGTIRWTKPKTSRHVTFDVPAVVATRCSMSPAPSRQGRSSSSSGGPRA
jgi:hypothetical protein